MKLDQQLSQNPLRQWFTLDQLLSSVLADAISTDAQCQLMQGEAWLQFGQNFRRESKLPITETLDFTAGFGRLENLGLSELDISISLQRYRPNGFKRLWSAVRQFFGTTLTVQPARYRLVHQKKSAGGLLELHIKVKRVQAGKWEVDTTPDSALLMWLKERLMYCSKHQWQYGVCYIPILLLVIIVLLVVHLVFDFQQRHEVASRDAQTIFQRIIGDAAQASADDISNQLLAVDPNNATLKWRKFGDETRIKVAAWMTYDAYKTRYKELVGHSDGAYTPNNQPVVWVTLVPQVQDFCRAFIAQSGDAKNISAAFRLKQYLGLNPHRSYAQFVELWVKPDDLLRPCPDPETDDTVCQLELDKKNPPEVKRVRPNYSTFLRA